MMMWRMPKGRWSRIGDLWGKESFRSPHVVADAIREAFLGLGNVALSASRVESIFLRYIQQYWALVDRDDYDDDDDENFIACRPVAGWIVRFVIQNG